MPSKVITIDGPSASGKGTLAKLLSKQINFDLLDSGALYRAFAFFTNQGLSHEVITKKLSSISFVLKHVKVQIFSDNQDITNELRMERIAILASELSSKSLTRKLLLPIQRGYGANSNLVADGRDMGTVVFPDADLKIYLDANIEIRAKRRQLELQKRGQEVNIHDLMTDILERDNKDMRRDISPLRKADDAFTIDSSNLSSEQVLNNAIDEIKKRGLI